MNKSSSAGQRIFCPQPSVRKMGNTYSIPAFSIPCLETKSLAAGSRRFNQSFPHCTNGCQIAKIPPNPISSICIAHTSFKTHILQTVPRLGSRQIIPPRPIESCQNVQARVCLPNPPWNTIRHSREKWLAKGKQPQPNRSASFRIRPVKRHSRKKARRRRGWKMKREAFFAECLSFAMKAPPKRAQNSPHRLICFPPILYPQY